MKCRYDSSCTFPGCRYEHPPGFVVVCRNDGSCIYGAKCRYRHLKVDQVPTDQRPLCKNGNNCTYGDRCRYRHEIQDDVEQDDYYEEDDIVSFSTETSYEYPQESRRPVPPKPIMDRSIVHVDWNSIPNTNWGYTRSAAEQREHDRLEHFYVWGCP